jgi:peptide methionine sulfoxide reductase msrA/msrB
MEKNTMDDNAMMNEGEMAPDFTFLTLDGDTVSLADFKGEKLYVKFWASWCPICIGGLEEIDTLSAEAEGFKVITVVTPNFRGEKSDEDFKAWYDPMKTPNLTVLLDVDGIYAREFGVRAYPTSAYIGSDSTLIKVAPGHVDNERIVETIGTFN